MIKPIETVGVVGLGVMGFDIAFLYAMKGHPTLAWDAAGPALAGLSLRRDQTIERLRRRGRITDAECENVRSRLRPASTIDELAAADLITEAVSEVAATKIEVYRSLHRAAFRGILTTNTSSLTRACLLARAGIDGLRFASTHFFNPVLHTQMVEIVKGDMDESRFAAMTAFLKTVGRDPVETADISGFVSNSLLMYYAVMALWLLQRGATVEAVDRVARQARLLAPFFSFDSWKPSIVEAVTRVMFELRGDAFLRSSTLLGKLARENPRFYIDQKPNPEIYRLAGGERAGLDDTAIERALKLAIRVAAARVAELGENPATVEEIAVHGIKLPKGPLAEIDELGAEAVLEDLKTVNRELLDNRLAPPAILQAMAEGGHSFFPGGRPNSWVTSFAEGAGAHASH